MYRLDITKWIVAALTAASVIATVLTRRRAVGAGVSQPR